MRRVVQLVALAVAASVLAATPGGASVAGEQARSQASGEPATTFNVPRPWGSRAEQYRIINRIDRAINNVPARSNKVKDPVITISGFLLDSTHSVNSLLDACRRGVGVRVVIDGDIKNRNSRRLIRGLNSDNVRDDNHDGKPDHPARTGPCGRPKRHQHAGKRGSSRVLPSSPLSGRSLRASLDLPTTNSLTWGKDRSFVKQCQGSCRNAGGGGNVHAKFYLFSQTGHNKDVVMVSSSNLNRGGASSGWNDLYVMKNRPKSYNFYLTVHRAMTRQLRAGKGLLEVKDGPFTSRFFPMRGAGQRNDPTLDDLDHIGCHSNIGATQIHISMFYWAGPRGKYLVRKLLQLAHQGCRISIIYGAPGTTLAQTLRNAAAHQEVSLYDSRWDFDGDGYNEIRTHCKFVTVRGNYRGDKSAHVVMTGSANWVRGSLSLADENTININLDSAYRQYLRAWEVIKNHSRRL